jgi:hypothetical protein
VTATPATVPRRRQRSSHDDDHDRPHGNDGPDDDHDGPDTAVTGMPGSALPAARDRAELQDESHSR